MSLTQFPIDTPTRLETGLTLLTLAAGGASPLVIVAAGGGWLPMPPLFWGVSVLGVVVVAAIYLYARNAGMTVLRDRIAVAAPAGIVLTLALDGVRVAGVRLGYLPDSNTMFGNMITGAMGMAEPTAVSYTLGGVYHLLNGFAFALTYSIVFGCTHWLGPVLYSTLFVETGMMILPPMEPNFGPFGLDKYDSLINGYYGVTLLAHLAMGLALAAVLYAGPRHRGLVFELPALMGRRPTATQRP